MLEGKHTYRRHPAAGLEAENGGGRMPPIRENLLQVDSIETLEMSSATANRMPDFVFAYFARDRSSRRANLPETPSPLAKNSSGAPICPEHQQTAVDCGGEIPWSDMLIVTRSAFLSWLMPARFRNPIDEMATPKSDLSAVRRFVDCVSDPGDSRQRMDGR